MNDTTHIGQQIVKARKSMGLSPNQLANRVGVKTSTLKNWENETRVPRANRLMQIAGILGVPFAWLIAGEEQPPSYETPDLNETSPIENKLKQAEQLVIQLSSVLVDIRAHTRRVQRNLEESDN